MFDFYNLKAFRREKKKKDWREMIVLWVWWDVMKKCKGKKIKFIFGFRKILKERKIRLKK